MIFDKWNDEPIRAISQVERNDADTKEELKAVLENAFAKSVEGFEKDVKSLIHVKCTGQSSHHHLLGCCTIGEFLLAPGTEPANRAPYRADPKI